MNRRSALATVAIALLAVPAFAATTPKKAAPKAPAFIQAAIANPDRPMSDSERDGDRKPAIILGYSGIKPGDTVAELIPAGGYSTRLISNVVGPKGHVYTINLAALNQNIKNQTKPLLMDPKFANVSYTEQDLGNLKVPELVDVVYTAQNYHDFKNPGMFQADTVAMDKAIFAALKPGGLYVIIDHVAEVGSGARDTGMLHRIDPALVKMEVMSAGFQFVGESKALANPADDHKMRVPGQGGIGDKSDKFFFKFRKPK